MIPAKNMSSTSRCRSFSFAINGLYLLLKQEPNARLHLIATVFVVVAAAARHLTSWQWLAIIFAIAAVWIAEAINTCIERLCDLCCDNKWHPTVKIIKDISAAAVFIASLASLAIGFIIFFC